MPARAPDCDVIVVGSGAAGLAAALAAAADGARVVVLEKARVLGGTTAMSSAGTWVPANHHMLAAGLADSRTRRSPICAPLRRRAGPRPRTSLWQALAEQSAPMLRFLEDRTPLVFELVNHPDFYVEAPGGKLFGRMVSPTLISRYRLGRWWNRVRPSVKPQFFTYKEMIGGILKDPWRAGLRTGSASRLARDRRAGRVGQRPDRGAAARLPSITVSISASTPM
jgi:3-oxosteroid 1-dehydrogenase